MNWRGRSVTRGRDEAFERAEAEFQAEQDAIYAQLRAEIRAWEAELRAQAPRGPWWKRWIR